MSWLREAPDAVGVKSEEALSKSAKNSQEATVGLSFDLMIGTKQS